MACVARWLPTSLADQERAQEVKRQEFVQAALRAEGAACRNPRVANTQRGALDRHVLEEEVQYRERMDAMHLKHEECLRIVQERHEHEVAKRFKRVAEENELRQKERECEECERSALRMQLEESRHLERQSEAKVRCRERDLQKRLGHASRREQERARNEAHKLVASGRSAEDALRSAEAKDRIEAREQELREREMERDAELQRLERMRTVELCRMQAFQDEMEWSRQQERAQLEREREMQRTQDEYKRNVAREAQSSASAIARQYDLDKQRAQKIALEQSRLHQ